MTIDNLLKNHMGKMLIGMLLLMVICIGVVIVSVGTAVEMIVDDTSQRKAAFMESCMKDKPEYECTAIWRPWM